MKAAVEKKLISGIVIAIVSVLAILVLSIFQSGRLQDTAAAIKHTNQVLFQVQEIEDFSQRYELGVKNFLLTGEGHFLDSAVGLEQRLREGVARLKTLTADNPEQVARIDLLQQQIEKNRDVLLTTARMSRGNNFGGVAELIATGSSIGYSRQIQLLTGRIEAEEQRLLEQRRTANQHRALELQGVLWILIAAVAILALVTFQKVRIDLSKEKEAREQLNRFNQQLEEKVRSQTTILQASEEKYKTLFYKSPLPKWIYDQETLKFLEVNEAAIRSYGYSEEEFLRMTISDIRPMEDLGRLYDDVEAIQLRPETYRDKNWRHIKKNGEVIHVEITAHPIEYEHRSARMVVVSDVTERMKSEQLLQQLNEDLEKRAAELTASNAELERFAYIASHDLQEPLRMVSSFLQLLQKKYKGHLDEKADQYIHYAVDGAERMKALIMDLLEYSRVGTGKESFGPVDMAAVLDEVGEVFREQIITTRAHIEIGYLPVVRGDKVQLTQLLQNLVGNALKYHSDRPLLIRIGAREEAGHWEFTISDNGIGIDPQFFDKIFIIFQRLHNKSDYSGTGIGLAICKKIVERHGGKIWVESGPEQGSAFFFTIVKQP
ncbi:MAG TPA: ATP-binding protein [Puia sp.]|jgi:PAS domain S-box-containing protein